MIKTKEKPPNNWNNFENNHKIEIIENIKANKVISYEYIIILFGLNIFEINNRLKELGVKTNSLFKEFNLLLEENIH